MLEGHATAHHSHSSALFTFLLLSSIIFCLVQSPKFEVLSVIKTTQQEAALVIRSPYELLIRTALKRIFADHNLLIKRDTKQPKWNLTGNGPSTACLEAGQLEHQLSVQISMPDLATHVRDCIHSSKSKNSNEITKYKRALRKQNSRIFGTTHYVGKTNDQLHK